MDREQLIYCGIGTEVVLLAVALLISAIWPIPVDQDPLRTATVLTNLGAVLAGVATAAAMFAVAMLIWICPVRGFRRIREFLMQQMAPAISACALWETVLVACAAGIGEELLFRGVLQPRIGWIAATILFGLLHAITVTYIVIACLLSAALAWLQLWGGNIWASIIAHAVYDFAMFLVLIRTYKQQKKKAASPESAAF